MLGWNFDACAIGGARCKKERWRTNVSEQAKRRAECHHLHDADEWAHAVRPDGKTHFFTKEEREFTAELLHHVALSLTFWVARTGKAVFAVPRLCIRPVETGSRKGWIAIPPH